MLTVGGEIARSFGEFAHAAARQVSRARPLPQFLRDKAQPAAHQIRFGSPARRLQPVEQGAIVPADTRVDVRFHIRDCSTSHALCATRVHGLDSDELPAADGNVTILTAVFAAFCAAGLAATICVRF